MQTIALAQAARAAPRDYAQRAYLADAVVHALSIAFALICAATLAIAAFGQRDLAHALALMVYGQTLVLPLSFSAAYNMNRDAGITERLRCYDHAGIFAMIAGTYTPLAVFTLSPGAGGTLLVFMWVTAAVGATIKLRYPRRFERTGIAAYLALGWVIFPLLGPMSRVMSPEGLRLMALGAIIYTIGVGFHLARRLPYNTVVWHVLVLAGAACHFAAIYGLATRDL